MNVYEMLEYDKHLEKNNGTEEAFRNSLVLRRVISSPEYGN
jgi:hypothetical protein